MQSIALDLFIFFVGVLVIAHSAFITLVKCFRVAKYNKSVDLTPQLIELTLGVMILRVLAYV